NLSSIVVRPSDDMPNLLRKMRLATIVGTYQATLTDFGYLSKDWQRNCEEEQLLGISITGYYDNDIVRNDDNLEALRTEAIKANRKYAKRFGSNPSTAITCVKPHGNSGQLLGVGSGMHPWFSKYFVRRVRISAHDPLYEFAVDQGVPVNPEVGSTTESATTFVLEFPVKAPDGAITSSEVSAIQMLTEWQRLKKHFTEHNPSVTIYADNDEWLGVADFVYKNWSDVGGLSFLPRNDHVYELAPYEAITEDEYLKRVEELGEIDFSMLKFYESNDQTTGAKELACVAGICEV
ncbi:MAG TPA: ribonucleoside-triphosphate reductase, partial [Candidatus Saccharibacteria bacterium]|nr:ribonucleoside-triphosphate reductase [Candidatus Saccharibacteria bacterium]